MHAITDTQELEDLCKRLAKADFVTVDTEFMRERTYYAQLCLIQLADEDGAFAVDTLAEGLDLAPFWHLMNEEPVLKVLHASRQDLEIFYQMSGRLPHPVFDTQVAAMVCGFGDSAGYEMLVKQITGHALDKSARFTDWSRRPLSDKQLTYALGDVTYLREIYRHLAERLDRRNRTHWVKEEMQILLDPETYRMAPEDAWKRIKVRPGKPRFMALVHALAAWREREAQRRDMPRNRIARDDTLLEMAANPPKNAEALDHVRGLPKGFAKSQSGKALLEAIEQTMALPESDLPPAEPRKPRLHVPPMADLLKVLLKEKCKQAEVAPKLVASAREVEEWAAQPERADLKALHGWRREIFGEDALRLISGDVALKVDGAKIRVVSPGDPVD
ncbi:ribonuclease D [Yunchengibacter salinarum]|uniref:ribonuclease D n=1 Tax=Yunchengibacter salinarum TaxID=3133399 RepID=UPI0035B5DFDE